MKSPHFNPRQKTGLLIFLKFEMMWSMKNFLKPAVTLLVGIALTLSVRADYFGTGVTINGTNVSGAPLSVSTVAPANSGVTTTIVSTNATGYYVVGQAVFVNGVVVAFVPAYTNASSPGASIGTPVTVSTNFNPAVATFTVSNCLYVATSSTNYLQVQAH